MQVLADSGACSAVDQSQVRSVSAKGSERVGYTSSLLRISQFDMPALRIWTITSLEWRKWFARRNRYFAEAYRNLQRAGCVSRHEPEPIPGLFSDESGCPR